MCQHIESEKTVNNFMLRQINVNILNAYSLKPAKQVTAQRAGLAELEGWAAFAVSEYGLQQFRVILENGVQEFFACAVHHKSP